MNQQYAPPEYAQEYYEQNFGKESKLKKYLSFAIRSIPKVAAFAYQGIWNFVWRWLR